MVRYGPERRREVRETQSQKKRDEAKQQITTIWKAFVDSGDSSTIEFFRRVYECEQISDFASNQERKIFREALRDFARKVKGDGKWEIEIPGKVPVLERRTPTKDRNWLDEGKSVQAAAQQAMQHWENQQDYSETEALGWLVFSAIVWGGLNEPEALEELLNCVKNKEKIFWVGDYPVLNLAVASRNYGNDESDNGLIKARQFLPDVITSMWLVHCYRRVRVLKPSSYTMEQCLNAATRTAGIFMTLEDLIEGSSYVWELNPGSQVPQALVRVATGSQKSCSLSVAEMARALSDHLFISRSPYRPLSRQQRSQESREAWLMDPRSDDRRARDKKLRSAVKSAIFARDEYSTGEWRGMVAAERDKLLRRYSFPHERRLIEWTFQELDLDRQPQLVTNSVERYFDAIADPWLKTAFGVDLDLLDAQEWETLYDEAVQGARGIPEDRLKQFQQFHRFQTVHYEAPPVKLIGEGVAEVCRARFMSPQFMEGVFRSLRLWGDIHEQERESLEVMIVLARRAAMRVSEITGLCLDDLDCTPPSATQPGQVHTLIVRSNEYSRAKTGNAYRRIPVEPLLRPSEQALLNRVWRLQLALKGYGSRPLFSPPHTNLPFESDYVSSVFKDLADSVMPGNDYSFHSLRHTALSTLDLVLTRQSELLRLFSDLSESEQDGIRRAILGNHPGNPDQEGQDHYFALAQVAGHYLPEQTFRSYLHFTHLSLGIRIRQGVVDVPAKAVSNIANLTQRQLVQGAPGFDKRTGRVSSSTMAHLVDRELRRWQGTWESQKAVDADEIVMSGFGALTPISQSEKAAWERKLLDYHAVDELASFPGQRNSRLTMDVVYTAIASVESGQGEQDVAYRLSLPETLVSRWVERARVLANIDSSRGAPRLIDPGRIKDVEERPLLPMRGFSDQEQILLSRALSRAAQRYDAHKTDLLQFMNHYLKRITGSRSILHFTRAREEDLIEFLTVGVDLFPASSWLLISSSRQRTLNIRRSNNAFAKISTKVHPDKEFTGYDLSLMHPDAERIVKQDPKKSSYSTNVMNYLVHMMLIAWPAGHQGRKLIHRDPVARIVEKEAKRKTTKKPPYYLIE